jgi:protein-S-isoprenylcysteine O-methyltransferase Ste14
MAAGRCGVNAKTADRLLMAPAAALGGGSIATFAGDARPTSVALAWPPGAALSILWSAWIVLGTVLEERDLVADVGDAYREYQRRVPMLVPWRGPVS